MTGAPASQKLKHQDAQAPKIHTEIVSLVEDNLRGHVLGGPAEGPGLLTPVHLLGKAKVDLQRRAQREAPLSPLGSILPNPTPNPNP